MKFLFAVLISTVSFASIASAGNGVERLGAPLDFSYAKEISHDARVRIEKILAKRCQPSAAEASDIFVTILNVSEKEIDQGQVDVTYEFDVTFLGHNNGDETTFTMVLEEAYISNPTVDKFNLVSFQAPAYICQ